MASREMRDRNILSPDYASNNFLSIAVKKGDFDTVAKILSEDTSAINWLDSVRSFREASIISSEWWYPFDPSTPSKYR